MNFKALFIKSLLIVQAFTLYGAPNKAELLAKKHLYQVFDHENACAPLKEPHDLLPVGTYAFDSAQTFEFRFGKLDVQAAVFSYDGDIVIAQPHTNKLSFWELINHSWQETQLSGSTTPLTFVTINSEKTAIAALTEDTSIIVWQKGDNNTWSYNQLEQSSEKMYSLSLSSDGTQLAAACANGDLHLWSYDGIVWHQQIIRTDYPEHMEWSARFCKDPTYLITTNKAHKSIQWHALNLVGSRNITKKIKLLQHLEDYGSNALSIGSNKKLFSTFSPEAQRYLQQKYTLSEETPLVKKILISAATLGALYVSYKTLVWLFKR